MQYDNAECPDLHSNADEDMELDGNDAPPLPPPPLPEGGPPGPPGPPPGAPGPAPPPPDYDYSQAYNTLGNQTYARSPCSFTFSKLEKSLLVPLPQVDSWPWK